MYEADKDVVAALKTILPTYYELMCDSKTVKPCITYSISNDNQKATGDTIGYSEVKYLIKLWASDLAPQTTYKSLIDSAMRGLGFKRISYNELHYDKNICYIWLYTGLAKEEFTTPTPPVEEAELEPEVIPAPVLTTTRRSRRNNIVV